MTALVPAANIIAPLVHAAQLSHHPRRPLRLYLIDSGTFKTTDMGRMLNQDSSSQPLRFHAGADETRISQLSAERMAQERGNLV